MELSCKKAQVICFLVSIALLASLTLCTVVGGIGLNRILWGVVFLVVVFLAVVTYFTGNDVAHQRVIVIDDISWVSWLFMLLGVFYGLFNVWVVNNLSQNIVFCSLGACWFIVGIVLLKIDHVTCNL